MSKILNISDYISPERIIQIESDDKKTALKELISVIVKSEQVTDSKVFEKEIFKREKLMSTGIGYGIAIPHIRHKSIKDFVIAVGISKKGVKYQSIDDQPVHLIFMIGASDKQDKDYIKLLSKLVLRLKDEDFKNQLINASSAEEVYNVIKSHK
jgi:fructose-specific phosphotransferase system IIA component